MVSPNLVDELCGEKFSAKWNGEQSQSVGVSHDEYRSELLQEFQEARVSPKKIAAIRPTGISGDKKGKWKPKVQTEISIESVSTSAPEGKKVRVDEVSIASTSKRVDFAIVGDKDTCVKKKKWLSIQTILTLYCFLFIVI